jgi:hypothetical protein
MREAPRFRRKSLCFNELQRKASKGFLGRNRASVQMNNTQLFLVSAKRLRCSIEHHAIAPCKKKKEKR